jgi:hypothetical protein
MVGENKTLDNTNIAGKLLEIAFTLTQNIVTVMKKSCQGSSYLGGIPMRPVSPFALGFTLLIALPSAQIAPAIDSVKTRLRTDFEGNS